MDFWVIDSDRAYPLNFDIGGKDYKFILTTIYVFSLNDTNDKNET